MSQLASSSPFFFNSSVNTIPLVQCTKMWLIWWLLQGSRADLTAAKCKCPNIKYSSALLEIMQVYCHDNSCDGTEASYLHAPQSRSELLPTRLDSQNGVTRGIGSHVPGIAKGVVVGDERQKENKMSFLEREGKIKP